MRHSHRLVNAAVVVAALLAGSLVAVLVAGFASASASAPGASLTPVFVAASTHSAAVDTGDLRRLSGARASSARVQVGSPALVPLHTRVLGALPAATRLSVAVALEPRDPAALSTYATAVATPGSAQYRHYLTVAQFRSRFGATRAAISAVRSALAADGLALGATSANGLAFDATGTAAELARVFDTSFERVALPGGRVAYSDVQAPTLAAGTGSDVQAVLGLSDVFLPHRQGLAAPRRVTRREATVSLLGAHGHVATSVTDPALSSCAGANSDATSATAASSDGGLVPASTAYTAQQLAQAYDYDPLYAAGDEGQGVTVGIYELEPNFPADITTFEGCYGISAPVSYVPIDGGAGTASASNDDGVETELDIENVIELAPESTVTVFQTGNSSTDAYDEYNAMVSGADGKLSVISTSWGECEKDEGATAASAENTLFEEAALQGTTIVAAAGDSGAQDCQVTQYAARPGAAVDDPASQPFVTGVGGTSMSAIGDPPATRPTEVVWNTGEATVLTGDLGIVVNGAGGGGVSTLWQMPAYQADAPSALNLINDQSSSSTCSPTEGDCREVPDVTADADYYSGYVEYWDGGWTVVGGTSGAAPLWASLFADADSNAACQVTGSIGFANSDLYTVAGSSSANDAADFNDVTSGNNDLYGTTETLQDGDKFTAMTAYDMASGLGSPVAANLVPALCDAAKVTAPAATTTTVTATASTATATVTTPAVTQTVTRTVTTPVQTGTRTVTTPGATVTQPGATVTQPGATVTQPGRTVVSPGATPGSRTCRPGTRLSYVQHPGYPVRETRAVVYVDGKRVKTVTGKRIVEVVLTRPMAAKFTVRLVTTLSSAEVISHQVTYDGCRQTHVITKVLHPPV